MTRKIKWTAPLISLLLVISVCAMILYFGPQASKTYRDDRIYHNEIRFSRQPGFYDEPFYLEIKAPGNEIYYTLDGTEPDRNSARYESSIYT